MFCGDNGTLHTSIDIAIEVAAGSIWEKQFSYQNTKNRDNSRHSLDHSAEMKLIRIPKKNVIFDLIANFMCMENGDRMIRMELSMTHFPKHFVIEMMPERSRREAHSNCSRIESIAISISFSQLDRFAAQTIIRKCIACTVSECNGGISSAL